VERLTAALVESLVHPDNTMTHPAGARRSISAEGFARLLARLDPDAERAAHEYERLRRALTKFFDWRGVSPAEDCVDEALDRLTLKLEQVEVQDIRKYAYGIARLVALERQRGPAFSPLDDVPQAALVSAPPAADEGDRVRDCFDCCLAQLPEESRSLILRYYEGERSAKILNRRHLASLLGVTENALRSRVQRLRDRLEECVRSCASQPVEQPS
jgi:DNA-directed RNA polymerase specialized sigma24 family protein